MLGKKIEQYSQLKKQKVFIESRLSELSDQIKKEMIASPRYAKDPNSYRFETNKVIAEVKLRNRIGYDEIALEQLLVNKGLWDDCSKSVVDNDAVEQAFYQGHLTEDDLREVRVSSFSLALTVADPNVQG